MKTLIILGLLVSVPAMADTQTRSWYVAHPETRARVNAVCLNDPGRAKNDANCLNAAVAEEDAGINRMTTRTNAIPTLFDQCASMPRLFQIANHCK